MILFEESILFAYAQFRLRTTFSISKIGYKIQRGKYLTLGAYTKNKVVLTDK